MSLAKDLLGYPVHKGEMRDKCANSKEIKKKMRLECQVANFM